MNEASSLPDEIQLGRYVVNDEGVFRMSGNGNVRVAGFRPVPVAKIFRYRRDAVHAETQWRLLRLGDVAARITLTSEELSADAALVRAIVREAPGLVVEADGAKHLRPALQHLLALAEERQELSVRHVTETTGWLQAQGTAVYVHRRGVIGSAAVDYDGPDEPHLVDFGTATTLNGFRADLVLAGPAVRMRSELRWTIQLATFGAPLARLIGRGRGPIFHIIGPSGWGKTVMAMTICKPYSDRSDLIPWTATINSIERALSVAGDQPVGVDDLKFALVSKPAVTRLIQNCADGTARGRLRSDGSAGTTWLPRALLVSTGEDFLEDEASVSARVIQVELQSGALDAPGLAQDANWVPLAGAVLHDYLDWLAPRLEAIVDAARSRMAAIGAELQRRAPNAPHGRLYETTAQMIAAYEPFLQFVAECTGFDIAAYREDALRIGAHMIGKMGRHVAEAKLGAQFIESLKSAVVSGRAVLGREASPPHAWSGASHSGGSGGNLINIPLPGNADGWVGVEHDGRLYIEPKSARAVLARTETVWRAAPINSIARALNAEGYLMERDKDQLTRKFRRWNLCFRAWVLDARLITGEQA